MRQDRRYVFFASSVSIGLLLFIFYDSMLSLHPLLPQSTRTFFYCFIMPKPSPSPNWTLRHEIKTADFVDIEEHYGNVESGVTILTPDHNGEMLALLHKSDRFHSSPHQAKSKITFDIEKSGGKYNDSETGPTPFPMYKYVVATGELGQDHEWCYVPEEFREWMKLVVDHSPQLKFDSRGKLIPPETVSKSPNEP